MQQVFSFTSAGRQIDASGNFIRYDRETSGAVDDSVRVRVDGQDCGTWRPGDAAEFEAPFSRVELVPNGTATGDFRVGRGRFNSSRTNISGTIQANVTTANPPQSAFTNTARTVTNASAQVLAANAAREYLLIQNKSASGTIWVCFGAGPATSANGIAIGPGGFWEWNANVPTNAVQCIGSLASNPDVLTVEG